MVRTLFYILSEVSRPDKDLKQLKKEINIIDLEEKFEESFLLSQYLYVIIIIIIMLYLLFASSVQ